MAPATPARDTEMHSDMQSSGTHDFRARENMHNNRIQSKNTKSLLQLLIGIRMAGPSPLAAAALGMAASLSLRLLTLRNIRGACRWKAISIASTKHRSSVSGQHRASAVAP